MLTVYFTDKGKDIHIYTYICNEIRSLLYEVKVFIDYINDNIFRKITQ